MATTPHKSFYNQRLHMNQDQAYPTQSEIDELITRAHDMRHLDTRQSLKLCLKAKELSLKIDYQLGYANSLYRIGLCQHILGMQENVLGTTLQALSLFQSLSDERGEADAYNLIGNIYDRKGDYADAIEYHHKSLAIRRRIGDRDGEAGSLNNIAIAHTQMAQFSDAFEYLLNSLEAADSQPSAASYALYNIAQIFTQINDLEKAQDYYRQSLDLNQKTNDRALESSILADLGKVHALLKNHNDALGYLHRSLEIARTTGNLHDQGIALSILGMAHQEGGNYLMAGKCLYEALEIMEQTDARAEQSEVLCLLGRNHLKQGKIGESIALLNQSLAIAQEININEKIRNARYALAEVYQAIGDFEQALNHYRIYHNIWKSFYSQDSERRIQAIFARSEIEKARQDAEEERYKTHQLSQALSEAQKSENEKSRLLSQLEIQAEMLEQLAREDGLTGLNNRRWLDVQLNQEFERARRFQHPFSIAMLDVDHFKSINDRFSHQVGDEVLRQIAKILRTSCRLVDCIGRYGGEEFMIILVETTPTQAHEICTKIMDNIRGFDWSLIHENIDQVTLSIGLGENVNTQTPAEMVAIADRQLYRAKQQGRDQICRMEG
jgi:diguanylate cyclase (GGDEF)-like protein